MRERKGYFNIFRFMNIDKIKKELKKSLENGFFEFRESGNSILDGKLEDIGVNISVTYTNPISDEYDNYTFSGNGQLRRTVIQGNTTLTSPKSFNGSAKIVKGENDEVIIKIAKQITIH